MRTKRSLKTKQAETMTTLVAALRMLVYDVRYRFVPISIIYVSHRIGVTE